jgi:Bacterial cell division membrane protein
MIDRRYFRYFDWISFGLIVTLLAMGLLFVFSATNKEDIVLSSFFKKQLFGAISGIVIYFIFCFINIQTLCRWGYFGYFGLLALLAYTIFGGWIGMGAKRWISLYVITFQPSEIVKLALPLAFAFYFSEQKRTSLLRPPFSEFIFPLALLGISFILILKQPDLGTAFIVLFTGLVILWIAQIPKIFFIISLCVCLLGAPLLWKGLKTYQQQRVLVLMGYGDIKKERYQVEQSKIAIGSGGVTGKGVLKGTQNRLSFLPEARTDFIFSVACEESGFLGALVILILFSLLFIRLVYITLQIPKLLDQLLAIGLLAPFMLSTVINIAMVTGMLPTVGIPLPLFTYGITHLWITFANLGILNNIAIRRFLYY